MFTLVVVVMVVVVVIDAPKSISSILPTILFHSGKFHNIIPALLIIPYPEHLYVYHHYILFRSSFWLPSPLESRRCVCVCVSRLFLLLLVVVFQIVEHKEKLFMFIVEDCIHTHTEKHLGWDARRVPAHYVDGNNDVQRMRPRI